MMHFTKEILCKKYFHISILIISNVCKQANFRLDCFLSSLRYTYISFNSTKDNIDKHYPWFQQIPEHQNWILKRRRLSASFQATLHYKGYKPATQNGCEKLVLLSENEC